MRLIDADALPKYTGYALSADEVTKAVENSPTIEAEPVRRGRWIIQENPGIGWYRISCSECGENVTSTAPCIGGVVRWDYCPYCGAKMEA